VPDVTVRVQIAVADIKKSFDIHVLFIRMFVFDFMIVITVLIIK
jgi:hypothetical protein